MGNKILGDFRKSRYKGFNQDQLNYIKDKFQLLCDDNGYLCKENLAIIYKCSISQAQKLIMFLDLDGSQNADFYKFCCGAALLCQNNLTEKANILYNIFNYRQADNVVFEELSLFVEHFMRYMAFINDEEEPTNKQVETKTKQLLLKWDIDKDNQLNMDEWEAMLRRDPDILQYMYNMGFVTKFEMGYEDNQYEDCNSDIEEEIDKKNMDRDERIEKIKNGIEHNEKPDGLEDDFEKDLIQQKITNTDDEQWKQSFNYFPSWFNSNNQKRLEAPKVNLDLEYIHGYRCHDTRNNLNNDDGMVACGKTTKAFIFQLQFHPVEKMIIATCMKEVNFITFSGNSIKCTKGVWGIQQPQAVLCVTFNQNDVVTGMFNGNICVWKEQKISEVLKGHYGPTNCICPRNNQNGFISGGRNGVIIIWNGDYTQSKVIEIEDFVKDLNYKPIIALNENKNGDLLVGMRGGEIIEVLKGDFKKHKIINQGHWDDEVWGLATHPNSSFYYTSGEDKILYKFDVKQRKMIKKLKLSYSCKVLAISSDGNYLAAGCKNGYLCILNPDSLQIINEIKEYINPDKDLISIMKFSPSSRKLFVSYANPINYMVVFDSQNGFKKILEFKIQCRINHMDFSEDGKTIQCNGVNNLLYYSAENGEAINNGFQLFKDEKWASWTIPRGFCTKGIWPPCTGGDDINAVERSPSGDVLVTSDDFSKVKLFKYPVHPLMVQEGKTSRQQEQSYIKFTGHSSHVTNVRFLKDSSYIISVGGEEKSVFQWKYIKGQDEPDEEENQYSKPQGYALMEPGQQEGDIFGEEEKEEGDQIGAVKPFLGELLHSIPSWYKPNNKRDNQLPDGDISLTYCHGYRFFYIQDNCRDMFFIKHIEDIVSFDLHPQRTIAATGQMAAKGKAKCIDIFVWDVETNEIKANFNDFHRRAVVLLKFSPNGQLLLSVGQDDDNSLAIYDWQAKRLVTTSQVDKAKVTSAAWKNETEFVTTGFKHVKFWTLSGRNAKSVIGKVTSSQKFVSQYSSIYAENICFTGGADGNVYQWSGSAGTALKGAKHDKTVQTFGYDSKCKTLYSGGLDGKILKWIIQGGNAKPEGLLVDLSGQTSIQQLEFPSGVVSLDLQNNTKNVLLGTVGGQIIEFSNNKCNLLLQGHFDGELWGLATSPNKDMIVTSGGDKTIRLWDINKNKMVVSTKPLNKDVRAVDWGIQDGKEFIVAADVTGVIYLLNVQNLDILAKHNSEFTKITNRQATPWIEDIKVSPCGKWAAFGAHAGASNLEIVGISAGQAFTKGFQIKCGLTSALLHLDWSKDSNNIVVNSQAYELKFVGVSAKKNIASSSAKDIEWATWTSKLGFPVQGVFQGVDYTDVNSVVRSGSQKFLASGNDDSKIKLFKYPVVVPKQVHKEYLGHSSHITKVRFTFDDNFLISVGGNDKCTMIWKTTFGAGLGKSVDQIQEIQDDDIDLTDEIDIPKKKYAKNKAVIQKQVNNDDLFEEESADNGDQFMAVKPWLGAIKEPTYKYFKDSKQAEAPPVSIKPQYCYGIRTKDQRGNLRFTKSGKLVYNAAALGIVLDMQTNTQQFFNLHTDDIISLDLNNDGTLVATGEIGPKPYIYVWDSDTCEKKYEWKGILKKGVACLSFNADSSKLLGAAIDDDHYVGIFDLKSGKSMTFVGGKEVIVDLDWINDTSFVTIGIKHFKFWNQAEGTYKGQTGQFGKGNNILSGIGFVNNQIIIGAATGDLQLWNGKNWTKNVKEKLHSKACETIVVDQDYIFTGGRDGFLNILSKNFEEIVKINIQEVCQGSQSPEVRSICLSDDKKSIFIATLGCEIFELRKKDQKITKNTKFSFHKCYMQGHFSPNAKWTNEVWGLAVFPNNPDEYATCSDDGTLRIWSCSQRKLLRLTQTQFNKQGEIVARDKATGDYNDSVKARAIAISPDGSAIVVGHKDGTIRVFESETLKQTNVVKQATKWISDIKFSPDGSLLVVGAHDCSIYCYNFSLTQLKPKCRPMKKHSSAITHIDFSRDGNYIHSTCQAYELLFWDVNIGKQLTSGASHLKDEMWATWTATLGWPVQGIWPECADGTDINAVDRSNLTIKGNKDITNSYYLLASADDFLK
ncbi:hypothetical protein IMG5_123400 [Ichthyophthirius multifiliis]|uniref:EF-hand domain-containing protein n=1 Tax=Ichthyophthirius multifiliis TaxID=5932 RepID=G0QVG1_ICHMU|nr:hypothetical protein IMG5_123400 [Ichthyophthirius multifiliis]EGR30797.1 hypothetical protein IMG5_123400 [Ichthyophthirius multifiliis]|eukprot:XP_004032384.1 hypothetical protein IMG5_123400 [Ichthyophthirius multifiliis]